MLSSFVDVNNHMDPMKRNRRINLQTIIETRYDNNQRACADSWGMKAPMINRWLADNVKNPRSISESSARRIEELEGLDEYSLDLEPEEFVVINTENKILITRKSGYISVSNASSSMGYGTSAPDFEMVVDVMKVSKSWVNLELPSISSLDNLAILTSYGDSMYPTFSSGDLLFVDRGVTTIKDDAIYVFSIDNDIFVKRIIKNPIKKTLIAKSDNEAYGQFEIEEKDMQRMVVHGMIVYAWNKKKL